MIVNTVVREWLRQLLGAEAARLGCGKDVRRFLSLFYADNGVVATRYKEMHGRAVTLLVSLFQRASLQTNTAKTKYITFLPGKIRVRLSNRAYAKRQEGLVSADQWERKKVQCGVCGLKLQA